MLQADFERLHKYMREIAYIDFISDETRSDQRRVAGAGTQAAAEQSTGLNSRMLEIAISLIIGFALGYGVREWLFHKYPRAEQRRRRPF
jgi:hypothetical protein